MRIRNKKINPTMLELIYGILAYSVIVLILMVVLELGFNIIEKVFNDSFWFVLTGFLIGIFLSIILVIMMTRTIENIVNGGGYGATKQSIIGSVTRSAIVIAVIVLLLITHIGNVFSMLFGLFGLKLSAYLQPITHKLIIKLNKKGR